MEQTSDSLNKAINNFEKIKFDSEYIRKYAEKFDKNIFKKKILKYIDYHLNNT